MAQNGNKCVTEVFSRVTGFMRPIQAWNPGKKAEQKERKLFKTGGENETKSGETS